LCAEGHDSIASTNILSRRRLNNDNSGNVDDDHSNANRDVREPRLWGGVQRQLAMPVRRNVFTGRRLL